MHFGRQDTLTVGKSTFRVATDLKPLEVPTVETRVESGDSLQYIKTSRLPHLRPIFKHSQQIAEHIQTQHESILADLRSGRLPLESPAGAVDVMDQRLDQILSDVAAGRYEAAEADLRAIHDAGPDVIEAGELLDVIAWARAGKATGINPDARFKSGADAFAQGKPRLAIEHWKACVAAEPVNRKFQLALLAAATISDERRKHWVREILALSRQLLAGGEPAEAYSLLVLAQSAEQSESSYGGSLSGNVGGRSVLDSSSPAGSEESETTETERTRPHAPTSATEWTPTQRPALTPAAPDSAEGETHPEPKPETEAALFAPPKQEDREAALFEAKDSDRGAQEARREGRRPVTERVQDTRHPRSLSPASVLRKRLLVASGLLIVVGFAAIFILSGRQKRAPGGSLEEAAAFLGSGRYPEAIRAYSEVLASGGDEGQAYLGRGRAHLAIGSTEEGTADLIQAMEVSPQTPGLPEELADALFSQGLFDEAVTYYERALSAGDLGTEGRYRLAASLVQLGRGGGAMEHLKAVLGSAPSHVEAQFLYGKLLNAAGTYEEAERILRGTESGIDTGDYYTELGVALLGQGKLEQAEETARRFLAAAPVDSRARCLLGETHLARKQYVQARDELIRALRIDPNDPRAQIALGKTWLAIGEARGDRGDLAKARQVLRSADGAPPGERLLVLGQVALAEGDTSEAVALIEQALAAGASPVSAGIGLARAKWVANDLAGAAEELERAAEQSPSDPALHLSLALVYFQLKDARRAAEMFLMSIQGSGLTAPASQGEGPVVLPYPHLPLPRRFDVNRTIRLTYQQALAESGDSDTAAATLKALAESTSFVIATPQ